MQFRAWECFYHSFCSSDLVTLGATVACLGMTIAVTVEATVTEEVVEEEGTVVAVVADAEVETATEVVAVVVMEAAAVVMEEGVEA